MILINAYTFLVGITLGSFFNVVGLRVPMKKSIVAPRSACPSCQHTLTAWELIPVFSYIWQKGKCKNCHAPVSPIYPFFELLTGILFAVAPWIVGWSFELIIAWTLISLFICITVSDIAYMLIPDRVLLVFTGLFLFERLLFPLSPWWDSGLAAAIAFLLLFAIAVISKGGMGGGDIKLFTLIAFVVGTKLFVLSLFLSALSGALFGIIAIAFGWVKRKQPIPFGPFIVFGTLIAYFWGNELIQAYANILNHGL